jgi:hypothetical protein
LCHSYGTAPLLATVSSVSPGAVLKRAYNCRLVGAARAIEAAVIAQLTAGPVE